jgi:hypothetical protein
MNFSEWEEDVRLQLVGSGVDAKVAAARAREFRQYFLLAYAAVKRQSPREREGIHIRFALMEVRRQSKNMPVIVKLLMQRLNASDCQETRPSFPRKKARFPGGECAECAHV